LTQREAKIFAGDQEIEAMTTLKSGFEKNDIKLILNVVNDKRVNLLSDSLIAQYLEDLLRSVRLKALVKICAPYKSVKLDFLASQMNVDLHEIRSLLAELILEEQLKGQIDQIRGVLELQQSELAKVQKHTAIRQWANTLASLN
jgi:COP9 signalosome complex subunit 2